MSAARTPDLRLIRQKLGLTQQQMAFALGTSSDSVYRWEKGGAISIMGRRLVESFVAQPQVLSQLLTKMTPVQLSEALGYPVTQKRSGPNDPGPLPSGEQPPGRCTREDR